MKRRIVSLVMAVVMVLSMLPTAAWAELVPELNEALTEETTVPGGEQGEDAQPEQEKQESEDGENGIALLSDGAVAEADGRSFSTLQAAFDYATNEAPGFPTIKLLDNVELDNYVYSDTGFRATLDLNGKTVSRQPNTTTTGGKTDSVFLVESGATLTIKDTAGGGQIVQPNIYAAVTANGGDVIIEGGTIKATSEDAENNRAIEVSSGTVTINGGTIEGAQIGVRVWGGSKLIVNGGTIHGETSYALLTSGTVELSGGTFTTKASDNYSIWNEKGTAESLLASAGYAYTTEAGERSAFSDDGRGVVGNTIVAEIPESVSYIGADGTVQSCAEYTEITDSDNIQVDNNWYVVRKDVTIAGWMTVCGSPIHLILCDGATLTVNDPIESWYDGTYELNVYLQSGGTGKLIAEGGMSLVRVGTVNRVGTPMKLVGRDGKAASDLSDYFEISKCDHDGFTYTQKDAKNHTGTCAYCGTELSGKHDFTWAYKDESTHTGTCKVCSYESTVEHEMRYTDNHDGLTHKSFCRDCTLTYAEVKHRFQYETYGKCVDCGAWPAAEVGGTIYTSLPIALEAAKDGDTVKLLADTQLVSPLYIVTGEQNGYANNFTLDLNGKTISYTGDGNTVSVSVALTICDSSEGKTGAITGGETYAVMSGWGGTLTITGGSFGTVFIRDGDEISGGTFSEIWVYDFVSTNPESLSTVLKDGYAFANSDGSIVNGHESTNAKDVTVVEHKTHTYDSTGTCACGAECPHTSWENGKCKDCGFVCTHDKGVDADVNCATCGIAIVAEVKAGGKTTYHADIAAALEAAKNNGTVKIIAKENAVKLPDQNGYPVLYAEGTFTLDLNGHTLNGGGLMVGGYISGSNTRPGNLTVIDSVGGGKIDGDRTGLKVQPGANVKFDGTATTVCSKLAVYSNVNQPAQIRFTGGVIHEIYQLSGAACADLLAEGYCFYSYDEATSKVGDAVELSTLNGKTEVTTPMAVGKCSHDKAGDDGKCVYCGAQLAVRDSNGVIYGSLTEAINAAVADSSIKWVQLDANMTESVVFDAEGKSVTMKMNGKTLTCADGVPLTVKSGTLTIEGAASITQTATAGTGEANYAVHVTGGKLVFAGDLTAKGGEFKNGNVPMQKSSVYAEGGELDFQGNITLEGCLEVTGSAKLTNGLSQGTFSAVSDSNVNRISVEESANYKCLNDLLADGYAFQDTDDASRFPCTAASMRSWSGNVTIVAHTHTWAPSGELYECTVCGKICDHEGGFKTGKCQVCGMPCPHWSLNESGKVPRCMECGQTMVAKIVTKNNEGYDLVNYYANLVDALNAVKDNETITLLTDVDNSGKYAILTGDSKTVTLDLNGKTVTSGWIFVGIDRDRNNYTSSTLKITGSGSLTGYVNIGYTATVDLSGWTGGKIKWVSPSNNGTGDGKLIVGKNAGTIEQLSFNSWWTAGISSELSGGTYGIISIVVNDPNLSVAYSDMLAPGYAFQYVDSGEYVAYGKKSSYSDHDSKNIYNVKVVECPHTPETVTGTDGKCACGQVQYEAQITRDGVTTLYKTLTEAVAALVDGDTLTLLTHVKLAVAEGAREGLVIDKSITFDLNGKTLSSSDSNVLNGILLIKNGITGTVTVKNGTVKADGIGSTAIRADSDTILEDVTTAIVYSGLGSVAACANVTIRSGNYQGLYVSDGGRAVLEGGTFRLCKRSYDGEKGDSIYWKVNPNTDVTSRDCMELLAEGYVYVDENGQPVRTFGGFRETVTVKKGAAVNDPVAKIGETTYATLHSAMKAAKDGETITLLTDLDLGNGAVLLLSDITTSFTIDLNGRTLSANGTFLVHMYENNRHVTLKNGVLDGSNCTGSGAIWLATRYERGELTLENVTAKSGTTISNLYGKDKVVPVPLVKVAGGTAVFNGGSYTGGVLISSGNAVLNSGEFYKGKNEYGIKTDVSGKNLSDYLGGDSLFWNSTSKVSVIDLSSVTSVGDVVVDLCDHKWDDGVCTVCKRVCGHQEPVDGKCPRCGLSMVASVDGKFYPDFASALEAVKAAGTCTLKLYTDFAYGEGQMNSNTLNYTKLTVDLNGYDLYGADSTSKVIQVIDGAELIVKDTSAGRNGSVDNVEVVLGTTTGGKLTLESGAIDALQADSSSSITLNAGAKVRYLTTGSGRYRFPVAALLPWCSGLVDENGSWADLSQTSVGSVTGTGYYTVTSKAGDVWLIGGYAKADTPYSSNTIPTSLGVNPRSGQLDAAKVAFKWYRIDGLYDMLAGSVCDTPNEYGDYTYGKTTVGSGSGWADMTVGTSKPVICVISGLDKDGNVLWCISSNKCTLTVTPADLAAAEIDFPYGSSVVFNGDPNTSYSEGSNTAPYCTVTLYGKTLAAGTDYTVVSGDTATAVGDYTLTLQGTGDYTGTKTAEWHVTPAELKEPWVRGVTEKVYDGTDALPDGRVFSQFSADNDFRVFLTEGTDFTISNAHYDTADVGEQKTIHFTVTLLNGNYTFDGGKTVKEFAVPGSAFVITKAAAPAMEQQAELTVTNSRKATYTVALPQLPTAPVGTYGDVRYEVAAVTLNEGYYTTGASVSGEGVLTLPIEKNNVTTAGSIGTVTVRAVTGNYEDILITVNVSAENKLVPTGAPQLSTDTIVYGTKLGTITLSGTLRDEGNNVDVPGTFSWSEPDAILDAGSHQAEWTFTPNDEDAYLETSGTVQVTVNKADAACTAPTANDLTYNGTAQVLVAAGSTAHGEMQYSLTENGAYSTTIPTGTDAGTYTVWYKVIGDKNHNDTAARSVTVELKRLDIMYATVELEDVTLVYTGQPLTQEVKSVTLGELNVTTYTVSGNVHTGSGNYALTVTGTGNFTGEAYARFDIHQAQLTKTGEPVVETLTYNGTAQRATVTSLGYRAVDETKVNGLYSTEENGTYDAYVPAFTDAGTYTVYFKALAADHEGAAGSFTVTVLPRSIADAKITLGESLTYNGQEQTQSVTSVTVDDLDVTYDITGNTGTAAGDYTLTITGTGNFTGTRTQAFTIARKDIADAEIVLGESLTYNGAEQTQNITSVTVDGLTVTYDVTGDTGTGAKTYTMTLTGTGNFTGGKTQDFTIARKDIANAVIELEDGQLVYNGEEQTKAVKSVTLDGLTVTCDVTGNRQRSAGTHTVTVTGTGNFTGTAAKDFTIAAKDISGARITLGRSLTYTGAEQTQTVASVVIDGLNASFTVTGNTGTNAGDYTLTVTGNGNFTGSETQTFTIAKAELTGVSAAQSGKLTYNGAAQTASVTAAATAVDGAQVTFTYSDRENGTYGDTVPAFTEAGSYTVYYKAEAANHEDVTGSFTVTIGQRDIADAEIVLGERLTYNGAEQTQSVTSVTVDGLTVTYDVAGNTGKDAKTYTMTLTGKGNFTGSKTQDFTIARKDIAGAKIVLGASLIYNGAEQTQTIAGVTVDGLEVTYDVTGNTAVSVGSYRLTITGTGNFTGTATADFTVAKADMKNVTAAQDGKLTYNGQPQTAKVKTSGTTADGAKVTFTYSDKENGAYSETVPAFTDAGAHTVYYRAAATGHSDVTGSFAVVIDRLDISKAEIVLGSSLTYNGQQQTQSITSVTVDGLTVTYDPSGNTGKDAGGYTLTVTGNGNFTGTASKDFTIAKAKLTGVSAAQSGKLTYNGAAQTAAVTTAATTVDGTQVTFTYSDKENGTYGDIVPAFTKAGSYTVYYKAEVANHEDATGSFTVTVGRRDIADAEIVLGEALIYNGKEQTKSITSVTVDGLTVTYDVTGNTGTDAQTYTMTLTGTGNFAGTVTKDFTIARKNIADAEIVLGEALTYNGKEQTQEIVSARVDGLTVTYTVSGDKRTDAGDYTLTVTGTGNFIGQVTRTFTIARKDMSKAVITLGDSLTYNGQTQTQSIASVVVDGLDVTYDVTGSTATDAGDYTLTITGTKNFTGTASKGFTIARKDIRDAVVDMNAPAYTGAVQTPVISAVRVDGMVLAEGTDYTALLKDAVSAGSYSVQLTGMGNFIGTAERKFVIGKAAAPAVAPIRVDVTNDYAADYTVDLRAALNAVLPKGCSFGTVQYGAAQYSDAAGYCDRSGSAISGQGILTLAVNKVSSDTEGHAATVTVTVTTANYQDITVTVELYAVNKAVPTGTPSLSRNRLSYGETLSAIRLWGSMRSGNAWVSGTFTWAEPNLRPESGMYTATWVFTPTDDKYASVTGTVDITVAEPPATVPTYKVGGIVKSFSVTGGTPGGVIEDAVVTIRKGLEVLGGQKITDKDGIFDLNGVTAGVYNVVVEYQGKTVTTKVEIVDHDVQLEVLIPVEDVNSQLEIKNPTALTDDVVVGGLDKEAGEQFSEGGSLPGGGSVSVSMDIQEKAADRNDDAQNAIRKELAGKSLQFISMDMTLVKNGVEQPLTETSTVLEIILSYNTGRRNITLARHFVDANGEDAAEKLAEANTGADGTFYIDKANGSIHIFTSRMSTYAIGYTSYSGGSSQPVKSAETGDIGLLPYATMTLSACTGVVVLRFRRKRED